MRALIQRVKFARVEAEASGELLGAISRGILLFIAIEKTDTEKILGKMLHKVLNYRIFADSSGKINLSLIDIAGELLIVSQFTLAANTQKGLRPSFSESAPPAMALELYEKFVTMAKSEYPNKIATGRFAENMQITLLNDGPLTFNLTT